MTKVYDKMTYGIMNMKSHKMIALDKGSGGYPYEVDDNRFQQWKTYEEVEKYWRVFNTAHNMQYPGWKIVVVQTFVHDNLEQPTIKENDPEWETYLRLKKKFGD